MLTAARTLKEARKRALLSQAELARRLGTHQPVVARWETGASVPSFDIVVRALRACGFHIALRVDRLDPNEERAIATRLAITPRQRLAANRRLLETEAWVRWAERVHR